MTTSSKSKPTKDSHVQEHEPGSVLDRRLLRRLLGLAGPHRRTLALAVVVLIGALAARLIGPKIVQVMIDGPVTDAAGAREAGEAFDVDALISEISGLAVIYLIAVTARGALLIAREAILNRMGQKIVFDLRNRLFGHVLRLPVSWFDKHHVGWTVTRTTSDVDALSEMFTTGVATIAYDILCILVIVALLFWEAPTLAVVPVLILPLMMIVSFRFRLNARLAFRATRASLSRLNAFLQERLVGLDVVRLFRREERTSSRFDDLNTQYYDDNMKTVKHFSLFFPTVDTLSIVVRMGTLVWGAHLIFEGTVSIGTFAAFWLWLGFVFEPIRELAERYNVLQSAMAAAERVFGVLDAQQETLLTLAPAAVGTSGAVATATAAAPADAPAPTPSDAPTPRLSFDDVVFHYGDGPVVLDHVSLDVARGERIAIVGHTGAGKTTLASLITRFHETLTGQVRLDGRDVRTIPHDELRARIAMVQQDVFLFSDTIAANIRMGAELSDEAVEAAARAVHAHEFIAKLPDGYDTKLNERGTNLSSGQRQLIAFARALAADPDLLILDEATSSVDSETEAAIEEATSTLIEHRTCLIIAHRLSTVVNADRIVVMHKGKVHEQGTHDELLAAKGLYHKLYYLHLAQTV